MKRSEMVDIIKDYLSLVENEKISHLEKAEYILGCCETWGMLPPERLDENPTGYGAAYLSDEEVIENRLKFKHTWEPEDE